MMTIGWVLFCARALTMFAISERNGVIEASSAACPLCTSASYSLDTWVVMFRPTG